MTAVTHVAIEDIVLIGDIAKRAGVSKAAVQGWMRKSDFPAPITQVTAGSVYDYADVVAWRNNHASRIRERAERMELS